MIDFLLENRIWIFNILMVLGIVLILFDIVSPIPVIIMLVVLSVIEIMILTITGE